MKYIFPAVFFFLLALPVPVQAEEAAPKTIIEDQAEADLLLGQHLFTENSLANDGFIFDYEEFSPIIIRSNNGKYQISGEHICYYRNPRYPSYADGGYVRLNGTITKISPMGFTVKGRFEYFYDDDIYNKDERPEKYRYIENCKKDGVFRFSRKGHPKYWRLQNAGKICAGQGSMYLADIFTKQLLGDAPQRVCTKDLNRVFDLPIP